MDTPPPTHTHTHLSWNLLTSHFCFFLPLCWVCWCSVSLPLSPSLVLSSLETGLSGLKKEEQKKQINIYNLTLIINAGFQHITSRPKKCLTFYLLHESEIFAWACLERAHCTLPCDFVSLLSMLNRKACPLSSIPSTTLQKQNIMMWNRHRMKRLQQSSPGAQV